MLSFLLSGILLCAGCGGGGSTPSPNPTPNPTPTAATPSIKTTAAQNSAVIVSLSTTTSGAKIYYTLDGSEPTTSSQIYQAPFLVASNLTVKALAAASGYTNSSVASQAFSPNIASSTLVWSDEFNGSGAQDQPNPSVWTYEKGLGAQCCGNNEPEYYCEWGSTTSPCSTSTPNAYISNDGYLHIVGQNPAKDTYTSARLKSQGLFSFMYGRIEARMKLPESQGMWPAFWTLGNNIATISWPACGEIDIMEHIDGSNPPDYAGGTPVGYDWIAGSVHGGTSSKELNGTEKYHPTGFSAGDWHTYGMIWSKGQIQFYVDDPKNIYVTYTPNSYDFTSSTWPFDAGPQFFILNLAIGGNWPGNPDSTTVFPGNMLVDYVHIYTN